MKDCLFEDSRICRTPCVHTCARHLRGHCLVWKACLALHLYLRVLHSCHIRAREARRRQERAPLGACSRPALRRGAGALLLLQPVVVSIPRFPCNCALWHGGGAALARTGPVPAPPCPAAARLPRARSQRRPQLGCTRNSRSAPGCGDAGDGEWAEVTCSWGQSRGSFRAPSAATLSWPATGRVLGADAAAGPSWASFWSAEIGCRPRDGGWGYASITSKRQRQRNT